MKKFVVLAILFALSGCAGLPEETVEPEPDVPQSLTIQTKKYTYTGTLAQEGDTVTWELRSPQDLVGLTFVCTGTGCTVVVEDVAIPLDARTAEVVREMLMQEK